LGVLRKVIVGSVAFLIAGQARAEEVGPTGVELGLRTGFSLPFGSLFAPTPRGGAASPLVPPKSLSDAVDGVVPIWASIGYRFTPHLYVGAEFQYGVGIVNGGGSQCTANGQTCNANTTLFGVDAHYHARPDKLLDPWGGIGVGYESLNFTASKSSNMSMLLPLAANVGATGFQLFNVQLGVDYKAMPTLGLGPFVMLGVGLFSNCTTVGSNAPATCALQSSLHEWLTIGLRAAFDVHFGH
jgi:hypothetical protein